MIGQKTHPSFVDTGTYSNDVINHIKMLATEGCKTSREAKQETHCAVCLEREKKTMSLL